MELLKDAAATLRFPELNDDPVSFSAAPKVTVTRDSDGTTILSEVPATKDGSGDDAFYTVEVDGSKLPEVDLLTAVWSEGSSSYTTHAEVVGGFLTSLKKIEAKLDEATVNDIAEFRAIASQEIEDVCGVAFRERYARQMLDGTGTMELLLKCPQLRRVLSVEVEGISVDPESVVADEAGLLVLPSGWTEGRANVEVVYVHGYQSFPTVDTPVRDLAAHLLAESPTDWNDRATGVSSNDGFSYTLVTAGVRGAVFPLPSVNAFVENNSYVTIA